MSPTLCSIGFSHVMRFNDILQKAISDEFLRFESYLKNACKRFVMELKPTFITDDNPNKDIKSRGVYKRGSPGSREPMVPSRNHI
ncbi:hypothetical protein H5410_007055 [Solanum commersonii]|uniref:Uncharacterized protein n=1 Tax=Solanum commersonii TaxID=4109 RepID=A0A9J6AB16_SOLCO|nr:hypothetical protein H5410_007055 [Solanum commersonii]